MLFILGLAALIAPLAVDLQLIRQELPLLIGVSGVAPGALSFDLPVMLGVAALCLPVFWTGRRVSRAEGALFVGLDVACTVWLFVRSGG